MRGVAGSPIINTWVDWWSPRRGQGCIKVRIYTYYSRDEIRDCIEGYVHDLYNAKVTGYWHSADDAWRATDNTSILKVDVQF